MNGGCYWINGHCTTEEVFAAAWKALGYQVAVLDVPAADAMARAEAWFDGTLSGITSGKGNAASVIGIIHDAALQAVADGKTLLHVGFESLDDLLARWL